MTKHFCDKCKSETADYAHINLDMESDYCFMLCDECWKHVREFIEDDMPAPWAKQENKPHDPSACE